jgi:hypothetical protein
MNEDMMVIMDTTIKKAKKLLIFLHKIFKCINKFTIIILYTNNFMGCWFEW